MAKEINNTNKEAIPSVHILCNCYWGDGMSGGDRRLIEILRRWKDSKYRLIVYTPKAFARLIKKEGIDFVKFVITDKDCDRKMGLILSYVRRTRNCTKRLKKIVRAGDFIYSPTDILPDVIPAYDIKKKFGNDVRWTMITYHIYETFYKRPGNIIRNFISCSQQQVAIMDGMKRADAFLTTSPLVYEYFENKHYDMSKVHMVDNAVDTELVEGCNLEKEGYDAVFLARLNNSKGVLELPEIWKKVTDKYPDSRLAIMGKGQPDMVKALQDKIAECHVEKYVDVLGYMEAEDAYSIMKHSKVFLFTSHEEGWGMALAEAQLCGLAVVAYNLPIYSKLFTGLTLCPLLDIDRMADGVCKYLGDEQLRLEDGQKGRQHILDNYSFDAVSEKELEYVIGEE